jgi:hypothetical protein
VNLANHVDKIFVIDSIAVASLGASVFFSQPSALPKLLAVLPGADNDHHSR